MKHKKPLIEVREFTDYKLVESEAGKGPLVVEGILQRSDTLNENGRFYPRSIWEKICGPASPILESIKARGFYGELDHPEDGKTCLTRTSHLITGIELKEDGTVWGRAEILPTPAGKIVEAIFRAGGRVGISSRGSGDTIASSKGEMVQEDFQLEAWDFVYNPSTPGAYPQPRLSESKQGDKENMAAIDKYKELEAAAEEVFTANLTESAPAVRQIVMKQAFETAKELSVLAESEPEVRALATGTIAELQSFRRKALKEFNDVTPAILDRLRNAQKTATVPTPELVKGEQEKVDQTPIVGGKVEGKMAKDTTKQNASPKRFTALISEMEAAATDGDAKEDEKDKVAAEEAKQAESALLKAVKKIREDEMPAFLHNKSKSGDKSKNDDGTSPKDEGDEGFDVPEPPDAALKSETEAADDAEKGMEPCTKDHEHTAECMHEEKAFIRAAAKLIRENAILRYRLAVRTKVAAASLAQMAEATKYYRRNTSPKTIVVKGERINFSEAAEVITELVKKVKETSKGGRITEESNPDERISKTEKHGELPIVRKGVSLREGKFGKNGGKVTEEKSTGDRKLDEAIKLGQSVKARMSAGSSVAA